MRKFSNLLFASICALSLLASCSGKDGDPGPAGATGATGPTGPSGQNLTGTVFGFVNSVDENGAAASKAGVTVTLEGATNQTAITDANGRYEFLAVRNGTYNVSYLRTGYGSFRRLGVAHVGGDQPTFLSTTTITQVATAFVTNLTAGVPTSSSVPVSFTLNSPNPANTTYRATFFASSTPGTTSATGTLLTTFLLNAPGPINTSLNRATLLNAGFAAGSTVYLVAYGSPTSLTSYVDPNTGRSVYTSLSAIPSNVVSFVL